MKIVVPFAGTENVGFQLYISNMPRLYHLCLTFYPNPPFAELLEGKTNEELYMMCFM